MQQRRLNNLPQLANLLLTPPQHPHTPHPASPPPASSSPTDLSWEATEYGSDTCSCPPQPSSLPQYL